MAQTEVVVRLSVAGAQKTASDMARVGDSLKSLQTDSNAAAGGSDRLAGMLSKVANYGVAGGGLYAAVNALSAVGRALFDASAQAQRLAVQLNFATSGNGSREMAFVSQVANRLGLELNSTAKAYAGFASAARGTSLEGQRARDVFESISMASAVMGLSADESSGALLAVQQMMSKGVVSAEEFRGQLGERMPIALRAGAAALGVTEAAFSKMLETGQIVAADFLPKFGDAIRREIGQAADEAAGRLDASVARVGNAWMRLKQTVGDSGISSALAGSAGLLANDMNAISQAMDRAKAAGSGFFGQANAGLGQFIGRALGLQFVNRDFLTLEQAVADATATIRRLDEQEKQTGPLSIYSMSKRAEAVRDLARANRELAVSSPQNPGAGAGRGNINPETIGEAAARKAKDQEALNALRLKQAKVPDSYTKDMAEVIRLNQAGVLVGQEYTNTLASMQAQIVKSAVATRGGNDATAERIALIAKLYGGPYGMRASVAVDLRRLEISQTEAVNAQLLADTTAATAGAMQAQTKVRGDLLRQIDASADSVARQVAQLQDEETAAGIAAQQNISLSRAINQVIIARLQEQRAVQMSFGDEQAADAIQREIDRRLELGDLIAGSDTRKAVADSAKESVTEWQKASDSINQSLTDSLMRAFESGKDFGRTLRDSLTATFKTMVVRPIISAIVNPIAGAVTGAMGFSGTAGAAGSAAGGAAGSGAGSMLGSIAGMAGLGGMGSAFSAGVGLTMSGAGGTALAMQGAGAMMTGGSAMAGLAQAAGALGPYALAAVAAIAVIKALTADKNAKLGYGSTTGRREFGFGRGTDVGQDGTLQAMAQAVRSAITGTASALGGSAAGVNVQAANDIDRKGRGSGIIGILSGSRLVNGVQTGGGNPLSAAASKIEAGKLGEFFAGAASAALIAGLQASDLPDRFKEYFGTVVASSLTQAQADAMIATASGVKALTDGLAPLGGVFSNLGRLGIQATADMASLAGGLEQFSAQATGYVQNYYNRDEIAGVKAKELQGVLAAAGISQDISSREQFRAQVDGLDITVESGRQQLATLLSIQGDFAAVADYLAETGKTLSGAASQAPLASIFTTTSNQQVGAINAVERAVKEVRDAVTLLASKTRGSTTVQVNAGRSWEVNSTYMEDSWRKGVPA